MGKLVKLILVVLALTGIVEQSALFANTTADEKDKKERAGRKSENFDGKYYYQKSNGDDPEIQKQRARAANSVNEVDAQQRYVEFLSPADLNHLPIGLKKKIGNTTVKIAISSAVFTPRYAELTIYAKIDIPQNNNSNIGSNSPASLKTSKSVFFGVKGLKLSKDGGIIGDAKLVLLGDYAIPMNGGKSALVLKGGFDITTGQALDKTYINIDCNGFKELGLSADVEFPRSLFIPIDNAGNQIAGLVKGSFTTVVSNWNDILASVTLTPFEIKGIDGVGFKIDNAVVDLSDIRNSADIIYPVGYKEKYLGNDPLTLNLWRGVYAKELRITLPGSFDDRTSSERVSFGSKDMIIDNNGLTGLFYAENILPLTKGSAGGWQFSVDSFRIALEANRLLRAGFGGRVGLPVNKEATSTSNEADSVQKRKYLAYSAIMSSSGDYLCRVITKDSINFDVWKANVLLKPNSYIELAGNKQSFKPSAMLHGSMNISSNTGTGGGERLTKIIDFKGIEFQGLHIKTDAPYLTAQYFGYNGAIKIGILPVSIDSIALKTFATNELGVGFNLKVNLQDSSFSGKTRLYVIGKYNQEEGLSKWKYDRLKIEDITINAKIGIMSLNGTIAFLDDDPKYGDGFRGSISIKFDKPDSLGLSVTALFGNKGFRYWFVDGMAEFPSIGSGVLNFNGFGGGAYYRMRKEGFDPTLTPTGLEYIPDSTAGLGIRASVLFNVGSQKLDHGQATFEVAFNRHGGMRYLGFYGYAKIMAPLKVNQLPGGNAFAFIKNEFKKVETEMNTWNPAKKESDITKKIFQPTAAAEDMYKGKLDASFEVDLRAIMGVSYDFNNRIFHANFDLYVSTPGNILTGVGAGGRAGWAVIHIDPLKWYMHMGTPTDPIGIKIGLGPISVQTSSYFMVGHDLPAFPPLPAALQAIMAQNHIQYESNINIEEKDDIKSAKGIAFGAGVQMATGDIKFLILYANFQAGMGFDVMVKDYSNYICQQTHQAPGINGWYAQGRVYAYLQGECGVRIKLGPIKKKIPIIKGAAVALLEARLPNPSWFGGLFHVSVRLLGGKIKINVNLKFSFGDECTLVQTSGGEIDFDDFKVVTAISPSDNTQEVSLFAKPVLTCLTPPEGPFTLPPDEEGGAEETYRPHIATINFVKGSQTFGCTYKLSSDSSKITIYPEANLTAQTDYVLNVKVNYQKLVSGNWVNVTNEDGTTVTESHAVHFRTGNNPPDIPDDNIGFMYPYKNQRFFYRNEVAVGRVLLTTTRDELFSSFNTWKARFIRNNQVVATSAVTYNSSLRSVTYPIPAQLEASSPYIMEIYGEGYVAGSLITDTSRPILKVNFNTSVYGTLAQKITAIQAVAPTSIVGRVESDVIDLQAKVTEYEGFDIAEMMPAALTGNIALIGAEAILTDDYYYNNKIQPLIRYPYFFSSSDITISRDPNEFGLIPTKAISLSSYYLNAALSPNYNTILTDRIPYIYDLNKVFNGDFIELRTRIVNKYLANMTGAPLNVPMYEWYRPCWLCSKRQRLTQAWATYFNSATYLNSLTSAGLSNIPDEGMKNIVTKPFPFMTMGDYKVAFQLKKPVSWSGVDNFNFENSTSTIFTYHNPIESTFFNEWQSGTFTKNNCGSGEDGGQVSYTIQPGTYSSQISQADANQKAINAINTYGQEYANQNGQCCMNGNCYVPGTVSIGLYGYINCTNYYSNYTVTFYGAAGSFTYDFPSWYYGAYMEIQIPAGSYQLSFYSDNYSGNTEYYLNNPWQSWYGTSATSGTLIFSTGSSYTISVNSSCGGYYE